MKGKARIKKETYTWVVETMGVNEAAVNYAVNLKTIERNVPVLKLVGSDNVLDQVAEIKAGLRLIKCFLLMGVHCTVNVCLLLVPAQY